MNDPPSGPENDPSSSPPIPARLAVPWGFWATFGWVVLIFFVASVIGVVLYFVFGGDFGSEEIPDVGVSGNVQAAVMVGLVAFIIWLRRGCSISEYLALNRVRIRTVIFWSVLIAACTTLFDVYLYWAGQELVPQVNIDMYNNASSKALLFMVIVVAAPLSEEVLFRGFLFRGWMNSRLGTWGTVLLSSLIFAAIHVQYDGYGMLSVLIGGLGFAVARVRTNSLYPGIAAHAATNCAAYLTTAYVAVNQTASV